MYSGIYLIYLTITLTIVTGGIPGFLLIFIPFIVLFLVLALGVWRRNRFAYIGSVVVSVVFLAFNGPFIPETLANPSNLGMFLGVLTVVVALVTSAVYSVQGARLNWRRGAVPQPPRTISRSGFFGLIAVGFILGGLTVGVFAGATEARLLASSGTSADISIVQDAATAAPGQAFSPNTFMVKAGATVTWINRDPVTHTVTSSSVPSSASSFDSGSLVGGSTFKMVFSQPGTYQYYCTIHPTMKGTIVVTSG